jgi:hypothetical protein
MVRLFDQCSQAMDEHTLVRRAHIRALGMAARWCQEQDCHFRIWSLCNFTHLEFMALAYVNHLNNFKH